MQFWLSYPLWTLQWLTPSGFARNIIEYLIKKQNLTVEAIERRRELRKLRRKISDYWNMAGLAFSILQVCLINTYLIFVALAIWRTFEILVCQMSVLFTTDKEMSLEKESLLSEDPRRLLFIALMNYAEVVLWFAVIYRNWHMWFSYSTLCLNDTTNAIYYSLVNMITLGYGDITPITKEGALLVIAQVSIGLFLTLFTLARFIGTLPRPVKEGKTKDSHL